MRDFYWDTEYYRAIRTRDLALRTEEEEEEEEEEEDIES